MKSINILNQYSIHSIRMKLVDFCKPILYPMAGKVEIRRSRRTQISFKESVDKM